MRYYTVMIRTKHLAVLMTMLLVLVVVLLISVLEGPKTAPRQEASVIFAEPREAYGLLKREDDWSERRIAFIRKVRSALLIEMSKVHTETPSPVSAEPEVLLWGGDVSELPQ